MKKREIAWIFVCVILLVALGVSIFLGYSGFYSAMTYLKSESDLVVGDTVAIAVNPNETSVASMTFDGSYLPNENVPQIVQISATLLDENLRVRVKGVVFGTDGEIDFVTSDHFTKNDDGYYYYDDILSGGNKATFCTALVMPDGTISGEKYIVTIVVETLSESVENIWETV